MTWLRGGGVLLLVGLGLGCASADFKLAAPNDAALDDGGTDTALFDAGDSGSGTDTRPIDAPGACPALGATADVWVDSNSTALTPTGVPSCPFRTIREGLAVTSAGPKRTVHVKGQVGGRSYSETVALVVKDGVSLASDGFGTVVILGGGGPCSGPTPCMVQVDRGGALSGFTVQGSSAGVTLISTSTNGSGAANLSNLKATNAADGAYAILVNDSATLAGQIEAVGNPKTAGLTIFGKGTVRIEGSGHKFNNNLYGIVHEGSTGLIIVDGIAANANTNSGVRINTAPGIVHNINGLVAAANGDAGLELHSGSIVLRNSFLNGANRIGVVASGGPSATLDFGISGASGNNTFGTPLIKNKQAGMCIDSAAVPVNAFDDTWSKCPVDPVTLPGNCSLAPPDYADLVLRSPGGSATTITGSCSTT